MGVHLITGGAGFIGVNLARRLLDEQHRVVAIDDLSLGRREFIAPLTEFPGFSFFQADCSSYSAFLDVVTQVSKSGDITDVWHLAANSDIPSGVMNPRIDLSRTFLTTFETLEVMRAAKIPVLHFASSSAVYGDAGDEAVGEGRGSLEPISNYGAMKLASEAQIRAAVEAFLERADIFRFPNVIGVPATHGVIFDLVRKARQTPDAFDVLGDGTQRKAYLHVQDLLDGMLYIARNGVGRYNVFNIGPLDDGISVKDISEMVRDIVAPNATIRYGKSNRGWVGDVPRFRYDTSKLRSLGWQPELNSASAVRRAVEEIVRQQ